MKKKKAKEKQESIIFKCVATVTKGPADDPFKFALNWLKNALEKTPGKIFLIASADVIGLELDHLPSKFDAKTTQSDIGIWEVDTKTKEGGE